MRFVLCQKTDPTMLTLFRSPIRIPPRTCFSQKLFEAFPDVSNVRPARDRRVLVSFSGSTWGTGLINRERLQCRRDGWSSDETRRKLHPDGPPLKVIYGNPENQDYMGLLNDTIFCPQPAGTTGKSFMIFQKERFFRLPTFASTRLVYSHRGLNIRWLRTCYHRSILSLSVL